MDHDLGLLVVKYVVLIVYTKAERSMSEGGTQSERGGASHAEGGRECLAESTACVSFIRISLVVGKSRHGMVLQLVEFCENMVAPTFEFQHLDRSNRFKAILGYTVRPFL